VKQPYCRYCGKKIAKWTITIYFVETLSDYQQRENAKEGHWTRYVVGKPTSKAEAQKLVNEQIISVKHTSDPWAHKPEDVYVAQAGAWDGERYKDEFFCSDRHAVRFAYAVLNAQPTMGMPAYHEAQL